MFEKVYLQVITYLQKKKYLLFFANCDKICIFANVTTK